MYTHDDYISVCNFLKTTGEGNVRKMFVGPKFTEAQFKVLMKVARAVPEAEFAQHWEAGTFPRVKLSGPEMALKEGLWAATTTVCISLGLLTAQAKAA